jgi:hypothetical protein
VDHLRGSFVATTSVKKGAASRIVNVFDDALVVLSPGGLFTSMSLLSTGLGRAAAESLVSRSLRRKQAAVGALGQAATSSEVAEKVPGAQRIPLEDITIATVTKSMGVLPLLTVSGPTGSLLELHARSDDYAPLLASALRDRFSGDAEAQ